MTSYKLLQLKQQEEQNKKMNQQADKANELAEAARVDASKRDIRNFYWKIVAVVIAATTLWLTLL